METFLKDKKMSGLLGALSLLALIVSVFFIIKIVNEVKTSRYIGAGNQVMNTISVAGKGEVTAVSDIATISVNLNKDGATAKEAQDSLNELTTKTLSYLKDQKIEDKDIKSDFGGLTPKYSYSSSICYTYPCNRDQKIVGYTATQYITIKIRNVDSANDIRTGLAGLGITDITGPTFGIDNQDKLNDEARAEAIKNAQEKAKVLAGELGVRLGKVTSFYENNSSPYPMYGAAKTIAMGAESSLDTSAPTLPKGENKITSNVTITYEIR